MSALKRWHGVAPGPTILRVGDSDRIVPFVAISKKVHDNVVHRHRRAACANFDLDI
jgi:hypothetical protein